MRWVLGTVLVVALAILAVAPYQNPVSAAGPEQFQTFRRALTPPGAPKDRESRPPARRRTPKPETGIASWYGGGFHGRSTASGEQFDMNELTAAHPTLPLGTIIKVTNLRNGKFVVVKVNDRGPFVENRIVDVSYKAAKLLRFNERGIARVRIEVLDSQVMAMNRGMAGGAR